ncbi:MAG TPA: L-2-hydroxyglutarate oxidase, partial [Gammaproteobacteria bacterium]|nr:L-2-hydroxyglutarate oxidase [Gammaproteobacteria bacterium]
VGAIRVPSTGIVSYTAICQRLAELIEADGGVINYNSQVTGLGEDDSGVAVKCSGAS